MHQKISSVQFNLEEGGGSPFKKFLQSLMITTILILEKNYPKILFIFLFELFPEYEYKYLDIHLVNMWSTNIFGYLSGT